MHGLFVFPRIDNNCSYERSVIFMKITYEEIMDAIIAERHDELMCAEKSRQLMKKQ